MRSARLAWVGLLALAACGCQRPPVASPGSRPSTGTLEVRLTDGLTGAPITRASIVGYDEGRTMAEVTPSGPDVAPDGVYRREMEPMKGRVRFAAEGYSETWTEHFRLDRSATLRLELRLMPLSRLAVTVLESDGSPVQEGTLIVRGPNRLGTMVVRDGAADRPLDAGRVQVQIDPRFMEGYHPPSRPVDLRPGETTELTIQVDRR